MRLKPTFDTIRVISIGAALEKSLEDPAPNTRAVCVHEKDLAFLFGKLGVTGENCRNVPGPVPVRGPPNATAVKTKIFCQNA